MIIFLLRRLIHRQLYYFKYLSRFLKEQVDTVYCYVIT